MLELINQNAGAIAAVAASALLVVTAFYAWATFRLLAESKQSRVLATTPKIVGYLRAHEVHSNIVQLCIPNLSTAAACGVTASITTTTSWPDPFDLDSSKILRDLSYMSPQEVLKFDVGIGPDLFKDNVPAIFNFTIHFDSLDGRSFSFTGDLRVESVAGHGTWQIYGIDDVVKRLKDISETLKSFTGFKRLRVDTFTSSDREVERERLRREREER